MRPRRRRLAPLAKITKAEAIAAAEAEAGGKATEAELGSENGALVFEVEVGSQEVKIDAGNGKVLRVETDDDDRSGVDDDDRSGADD